MLLVIVGAGASCDSIPSRPIGLGVAERFRPPLADQLFEAREIFEEVQRAVPQVQQIGSTLLYRPPNESVEDVLARYASETTTYPHRETQLAAVRFYLQGIIEKCEEGWYREKPVGTNLMTLIDQIERVRRNRSSPIFVTFNYDRLIEFALENRGQQFDGMPSYISPTGIRLYKLHGSVDWARRIERMDRSRFQAGGWPVAKQICDEIRNLPVPGPIERYRQGAPSSVIDTDIALPAIAIPVKEKSKFECPDDHLASLKSTIPEVTTVLTVGWRGAELHFLELLRNSGLKPVDGICVAGRVGEAQQIRNNLIRAGVRGEFELYDNGFSNFVIEKRIERLLNLTWRE